MLQGRVKEHKSDTVPVNIPYRTQGLGWERPLEPQVVKVLSQNRAKFYLRGELPLYSTEWNFPLVGGQRVKRLAVTRVRVSYNIYNITIFNNTFGYYIGGGLTTYDGVQKVQLTPGQYTLTALATEIQTQLNAVAPPLTVWSVTVSPTNPNQFVIQYTGASSAAFITGFTNTNPLFGTAKDFINTALNNPYGIGLRGITLEEALISTNRATTFYAYMLGFGVRYLDVCSRALTMDSKTMCPDLLAPPGLLTRVYLPNPTHGELDEKYNDPATWFNIEDRPITNVDLQFVPSQYYTGPVGSWGPDRLTVEVEITIEY